MDLLVFAHRGEARAFLQEDSYSPITFHFDGLFYSESTLSFLLITGEGPREASEKTVAVLAVYRDKIKRVINLGTAGSLNEKLKKHDLVWVRSSFAHNSEKMEFKSFTTSHHSKHDCTTSFHRVFNLAEKKALSAFSDIVDRELWSILSACHLFKIEGLALKVISDEFTDENNFCELVKSEALTFSTLLFKEWTKYNKNIKAPAKSPHQQDDALEKIINHSAFHFTVTQRRKLEGLFRSLKLKGIFLESELITFCEKYANSEANEGTPKELSKSLLTALEEINNPIKLKIKNKIKEAVLPLTNAGIIVHTDPELESSHVQLSMTIHSLKDQKKCQLALEQFHFEKIKNIFQGHFEDDV